MNKKTEIRNCVIDILFKHPNGLAKGDLLELAQAKLPHIGAATLSTTIQILGDQHVLGRPHRGWYSLATLEGESTPTLPNSRRQPRNPTPMFIDSSDFLKLAMKVMGKRLGTSLLPGLPNSDMQWFPLVSADESIAGDIVYFTIPGGRELPGLKAASISQQVWLLEKSKAKTRFLVFGNQKQVPTSWLDMFGRYVDNVDFYFLTNDGSVEKLER